MRCRRFIKEATLFQRVECIYDSTIYDTGCYTSIDLDSFSPHGEKWQNGTSSPAVSTELIFPICIRK